MVGVKVKEMLYPQSKLNKKINVMVSGYKLQVTGNLQPVTCIAIKNPM